MAGPPPPPPPLLPFPARLLPTPPTLRHRRRGCGRSGGGAGSTPSLRAQPPLATSLRNLLIAARAKKTSRGIPAPGSPGPSEVVVRVVVGTVSVVVAVKTFKSN
ncbi:unnamed protein product [Lampetra planeri]